MLGLGPKKASFLGYGLIIWDSILERIDLDVFLMKRCVGYTSPNIFIKRYNGRDMIFEKI